MRHARYLCGRVLYGETVDAVLNLRFEKGIIHTEGKELDPVAADLGLTAAAQRVEHYEIAAYGASAKFAESMGREDIAELLSQTLEEENKADHVLTLITQPLLDAASEEAEDEIEEEKEPVHTHDR